MKDTFLVLFGGISGMVFFALIQIARELYGFHKEDQKCQVCGVPYAESYHVEQGAVCAACEINLRQVEKQLRKIEK
jgi:hypothetical protein